MHEKVHGIWHFQSLCYNPKYKWSCDHLFMLVKTMTLTLGKKEMFGSVRISGIAVPVLAMTAVLAYSSILGSLVNYSADQDLTVHAMELSKAELAQAADALPAEEAAVETAATILDGRFPKRYLNDDTALLQSDRAMCASIGEAGKREMVYLLEKGDEFSRILTADGSTGYVRNNVMTGSLANIFDACNETKWIASDTAAILE